LSTRETANSGAVARLSTKISCSTKQGIISAEQGILAQEQGIVSAKTEINADEVFGIHNGLLHCKKVGEI
jgi:hypothetical protein